MDDGLAGTTGCGAEEEEPTAEDEAAAADELVGEGAGRTEDSEEEEENATEEYAGDGAGGADDGTTNCGPSEVEKDEDAEEDTDAAAEVAEETADCGTSAGTRSTGGTRTTPDALGAAGWMTVPPDCESAMSCARNTTDRR